MSTSNHASVHSANATASITDSSLTNSQRHKVSVLIEPPAGATKSIHAATVDFEEYAPTVPISHPVAPEVTPSASVVIVDSAKPASPAPVVWLSHGATDPAAKEEPAFVSLNFTLPTHLTPQPATTGTLEPILRFEAVKIEPVVVEAPIQNAQIEVDTPTPKPSDDSVDTPTPKPVEVSEPVSVGTSLGYSSTFSGVPSRSTGISPPNESYIQASSASGHILSYSQAFSGKAFSESSASNSTVSPYAGPSYTTVTTSVSSYAGPATSAVSYTSAN